MKPLYCQNCEAMISAKDDMLVDPNRGVFSWDGGEVKLPPSLLVLVRELTIKPCSRKQLYHALYADRLNDFPDEKTVDVLLSKLRTLLRGAKFPGHIANNHYGGGWVLSLKPPEPKRDPNMFVDLLPPETGGKGNMTFAPTRKGGKNMRIGLGPDLMRLAKLSPGDRVKVQVDMEAATRALRIVKSEAGAFKLNTGLGGRGKGYGGLVIGTGPFPYPLDKRVYMDAIVQDGVVHVALPQVWQRSGVATGATMSPTQSYLQPRNGQGQQTVRR